MKFYILHSSILLLMVPLPISNAQIGNGWVEYKPERKIHLVDFNYKGNPKGMYNLEWKDRAEVGDSTPASSYVYDRETDIETFTLHDKRANRSEIRLHNDYGEGSRQFEGCVTFYPPLNDESLMQIWGSDEGATQLMIHGYAANGGDHGLSRR